MSKMNRLLMRLTRKRPMKTIEINGPYLERYYMGTVFGRQLWLHRFLSSDGERHLHNHPWNATSIVLAGGYLEELVGDCRYRLRWSAGKITMERLHRISSVDPGTWTLMIVEPGRIPWWDFVDHDGKRVAMRTSPEDWWKRCGVRGG